MLNLSLLDAGVASSRRCRCWAPGRPLADSVLVITTSPLKAWTTTVLSTTGPLITIPNDAVDSFTVLQNQYSAEFGHSSGGQFNQTIKSGTNQFHGTRLRVFPEPRT